MRRIRRRKKEESVLYVNVRPVGHTSGSSHVNRGRAVAVSLSRQSGHLDRVSGVGLQPRNVHFQHAFVHVASYRLVQQILPLENVRKHLSIHPSVRLARGRESIRPHLFPHFLHVYVVTPDHAVLLLRLWRFPLDVYRRRIDRRHFHVLRITRHWNAING